MANLETLELTINGNAQGARQGVESLIRSLSALSDAIAKPVNGLMKLNAELAKLKTYGRMKLPDVGKASGATAVKAGAVKQAVKGGAVLPEFRSIYKKGGFASWMYGPRPPVSVTNNLGTGGMIPDEQMRKLRPEWYVQPGSQQWKDNITARNEALKPKVSEGTSGSVQSVKESTSAINENVQAVKAQKDAINGVADANKVAATETKNATTAIQDQATQAQDGAGKAHKFGESVSAAFSKIGRIASTMVTRMALKALIKNFTEAWKAAYNFSKKIGGDFAANIDKVRGALGSMATNIIKAFSPLMSIIAPIFTVMATGIEYLTKALNGLLSLLGISGDLLGASTEQIAATGSASQKAAKDVLAGFDELNVIDSSSSGGGGSGGGSTFTAKFQEEIDSIKMIVAESMLAVGLILAFSGHVGVGLAMAAVGAATIVGTIVEKWGTLSDKVKGEITTIMAIAGGAMLAIGAIIAFACPAKAGLGIALMAAGVANVVAAASLSWNLDETIRKKVGIITGILGGALLAVGAILALSGANIPLGIGMMVAGGISLASAVALNWDSVKNAIINTFNAISKGISEAWEKVKKAIAGAWDQYMSWTGIKWSDISSAWNQIKDGLKEKWEIIKNGVYQAWGVVKNWIDSKWQDYGGWEGIKSRIVGVWNNIKTAVSNAWLYVSYWLSQTWGSFQQKWENIKSGLSNVWNSVKDTVVGAWTYVVQWINTTWGKFSTAWNDIKDKISGIWNSIGLAVTSAYNSVAEWWDTTKNGMVEWIKDAWKGVASWFQNNVTGKISQLWEGLKETAKSVVNFFIRGLNSIGTVKIPKIQFYVADIIKNALGLPSNYVDLYGGKTITLWNIPTLAEGAYDIPSGQMFIANEAGAEMVGSMDGHTAVANQQQIVEGIRKGVADGQAEQNNLLRRQNEILLNILQKEGTVRLGASSALGRTVKQSLDMYSMTTGV